MKVSYYLYVFAGGGWIVESEYASRAEAVQHLDRCRSNGQPAKIVTNWLGE